MGAESKPSGSPVVSRESPAAYGIDFGVTADGRTLLVAVNDAYCLDCMTLPSAEYADMLEDRCVELMTGRCV